MFFSTADSHSDSNCFCYESNSLNSNFISYLVYGNARQETMNYISAIYSASAKKFCNFVNSVKGHCMPPPPLSTSGKYMSSDSENTSILTCNLVFATEICAGFPSLHESTYLHPVS